MPTDLLERSRELEVLGACLDEVRRTARGLVVLVGGEAGVGKSALVRHFCEEQGSTAAVLSGDCDPLFTPRPLGPLLAVAEATGGELAKTVESGAHPHEVAASLARELHARSPSIFVLEDLHWADEATLDVLRLLIRRLHALPTLVVATYRDDAMDRSHPLRMVLGELANSATVRRLKLAPLSPAAVAQLAGPHHVDSDELYRKTAGNPFFVVEALSVASDAIPDTVRDAVLARAARLGQSARSLLECVAILPPHAELWLLQAVADDSRDALEECLTSGMLNADARGVAFRHELARLAIDDSIVINRKIELHRRALEALTHPQSGVPDLARLAHHAEAAGDASAVLRFAPAAAALAASLGSYREAAAQYARALRFGDQLAPADRAELLEQRARACYLTDQSDACIAALEEALDYRRQDGNRVAEGNTLRQLSDVLWCPGRTRDSGRYAREAVALLEQLPPGRELAAAYANLAQSCSAAAHPDEAVSWGNRALDLAEQLGATEIAVHAQATIGVCQLRGDGKARLEQSLERAQAAGLDEHVGRAYLLLASPAVEVRQHDMAVPYLEKGIAFCSERGQELYLQYLLAYRGRVELDQGRWTAATESAATVLRVDRKSITPRILALVVLSLVRARRGDPEYAPLLEEAWLRAHPTGEIGRLGWVAAARAEAAWLEGDSVAVDAATSDALALAIDRGWSWLVGDLVLWRHRAGLPTDVPTKLPKQVALELAGDAEAAAAAWSKLGSPYEAAVALGQSTQESSLRAALEQLQRYEARPASAIIMRRLRERGIRGVPRGPRPTTRNNPAMLTRRELEVLALVADGLRDVDIAERLVLSDRTVGHHVSSILSKLGVRTRAEATSRAFRMGVSVPDR